MVAFQLDIVEILFHGNLTFSLPSETDFVSKRVVNNNKSARIYRIAISAIDSPGSSELRTRPVDGELLFAPRQLALQAGESEYFKFYYHRRYGPVDRPAQSITVIKVLSMYRWPTHSGLRKPDYWHQQEVLVTRMTTRWRRASMAFTKRR